MVLYEFTHPKPLGDTDWNAFRVMHANFSTLPWNLWSLEKFTKKYAEAFPSSCVKEHIGSFTVVQRTNV